MNQFHSDLPVELLEHLLLKAMLAMFKESTRLEKDERAAVKRLASVCRAWWLTINGWPESRTRHWFKHELERRINPMRLRMRLAEREPVWGVTVLEKRVYVLRDRHENQIEVYNENTLIEKRPRLSVPGMGVGADMTSCPAYRCLYISDSSYNVVHRVDVEGDVTGWSVEQTPAGLSVTKESDVLVTCNWACVVKEYTTRGDWLRTVRLNCAAWHSIRLSSGQLAICYGDSSTSRHDVIIADHATSYSSSRLRRPDGKHSLNWPRHLAVDDKNGNLFVADYYNQRVVVLSSSSLRYVRNALTVCEDGLKGWPYRLCFDAQTSRLYVAENLWKGNKWMGRVVAVNANVAPRLRSRGCQVAAANHIFSSRSQSHSCD